MPAKWVTFFTIFLAIYSLANLYSAWRGWQTLHLYYPALNISWYVLLCLFLTLAYPLGRFGESLLPLGLINKLTIIGSYWFGMIYYLFLLTVLLDLCSWAAGFAGFAGAGHWRTAVGMPLVLAAATSLLIYGIYNANHPVIRNYKVTIQKPSPRSSLHVVMVSDIHLGKIVTTARLHDLIKRINDLQPELVLLPGDIIDEDVDLFADKRMADAFTRLNPPLGTYAVLGNHEYIGGKSEAAIIELQRGGIKVLRDAAVKIDDSFYLAGRDDYSRHRFAGLTRAPLAAIMQEVDTALPVILLDHQPADLAEAEAANVDLQLSGHTHRGQMFPNHLITQAVYEVDWGYLRKNRLQVIVSCGYGTWGPPIRIGNQPEIVNLIIHFNPKEAP